MQQHEWISNMEWKRPDMIEHTQYDFIYMKFLIL